MYAYAEKVDPGPLKILEDLLWEWTWLNRDMARSWGWKDCPWWCNERASISTLAGAAWNSRGVALEEYASKKREGHQESLGRCDLYFRLEGKGYIAEAKHCWLRAGVRADNMPIRILKYLTSACKDVKKNAPSLYRNETLLGIAFIVPRIPSEYEYEAVGNQIKSVQEALIMIAKEQKCALAWIFPRGARGMAAEDDDYIYPGRLS